MHHQSPDFCQTLARAADGRCPEIGFLTGCDVCGADVAESLDTAFATDIVRVTTAAVAHTLVLAP